mgnify:CR=1 FL=1
MIKNYQYIIVEFQRELKGELDENSVRISRRTPGQILREFHENYRNNSKMIPEKYRRILGEFKEEFQENSRDNSLGIHGVFLEDSRRLPGGFWKVSWAHALQF